MKVYCATGVLGVKSIKTITIPSDDCQQAEWHTRGVSILPLFGKQITAAIYELEK